MSIDEFVDTIIGLKLIRNNRCTIFNILYLVNRGVIAILRKITMVR